MGETPDAGLINRTLLAGEPPRFVVQRVSRIFGPAVHDDIEAVTAHLDRCGMVTPRLLPTDVGGLWARDAAGDVWRALTFVAGQTVHRLTEPAIAHAAGALVARFHGATDSLDWDYRHVRPGAHNTPAHMLSLEGVASGASAAVDLAGEILEFWAGWQGALDLPGRHAHGDLKISNLRFRGAGGDSPEGVCLLDLDTLSLLSIDVELGDALRSWCNPVGEDGMETYFDLRLFEAAMAGYQSVRTLSGLERAAVVSGAERIALELASRFCRDAIEDCYFGWDVARFPSRVAHNLFRASGQLALARSVRRQRPAMERLLAH
ncbi:MAG: hypothetical protein EXR69_08550 [Myxococcales bacterium]|nr:hypothetical protein [Myxococcales bacterium]